MDKAKSDAIVIHSQRLAGYLMYNGFVLFHLEPKENGNGKNVFYFRDSLEIRSKINQYNYNKRR